MSKSHPQFRWIKLVDKDAKYKLYECDHENCAEFLLPLDRYGKPVKFKHADYFRMPEGGRKTGFAQAHFHRSHPPPPPAAAQNEAAAAALLDQTAAAALEHPPDAALQPPPDQPQQPSMHYNMMG